MLFFSSQGMSLTLVTQRTTAQQASLSFTISWSLLRLLSVESVMPSNHLILCRPLSFCPQSFPASGSFQMSQLSASCGLSIVASASVLPMSIQEVLILKIFSISFKIDWFDPLAIQGTLKSLAVPQSKSINSLVIRLLYGPTLTPIHDYWKNHSFD